MTLEDESFLTLLRKIEKRLHALEEAVNAQNLSRQTFHIDRVQTMNVHELVYRLENIDVKQVNGTMNIGNTFLSKSRQQLKRENDISIIVNGKHIPYEINEKKNSRPLPDHDQALSSSFRIGDIHIGTVEGASAVNFGNNFPSNFKNSSKLNQGFGNILGNGNDIHDIFSHQDERDTIKVFSEGPDQPQPEWLKSLKEEQNDDTDDEKEEKQ